VPGHDFTDKIILGAGVPPPLSRVPCQNGPMKKTHPPIFPMIDELDDDNPADMPREAARRAVREMDLYRLPKVKVFRAQVEAALRGELSRVVTRPPKPVSPDRELLLAIILAQLCRFYEPERRGLAHIGVLLAAGARPDFPLPRDFTPWRVALESGAADLAERLRPRVITPADHEFAVYGNLAAFLSTMLAEAPVPEAHLNELLELAVEIESVDCVAVLLGAGARPETVPLEPVAYRKHTDGDTQLHTATRSRARRMHRMVEALLPFYAGRVDVPNTAGHAPIRTLFEREAYALSICWGRPQPDDFYYRPMCSHGRRMRRERPREGDEVGEEVATLRLLLDAGADFRALSPKRGTLLHAAGAGGCPESVRLLAGLGLDLEAVSESGHTPLAVALAKENPRAATELVRLGAAHAHLIHDRSWCHYHNESFIECLPWTHETFAAMLAMRKHYESCRERLLQMTGLPDFAIELVRNMRCEP
jgi:hypothetical protein